MWTLSCGDDIPRKAATRVSFYLRLPTAKDRSAGFVRILFIQHNVIITMCWENHFRVLILLVLGRRKKMLINVNLLAIILLLQQSGKMRRRSSVYKLFFFFSITEYISVFFDIIIQQWLLAD